VIHIAPTTEDRYALIIGINEYTWGPPNLLGAPIKNAEGIYELLTKGFEYREENVELLTSIDETTKSSIIEAYERLSDKSNNGRNTLFYHHSGHGDQENVLIVHGQEVIEFSDLWMYDTGLRDYFNPIKNIGIVFDTCYSGGFCTETDESRTHLDLIGIYTDEGGIDIMDNTQQIILMSSRSEYETIVSKGVPMLFTDFLIRAFTTARESANKDDDPRISLQEAYDYANDNCAIRKEYMFNWEEDEEGNLRPTEERIRNHPVISDNYDGEFYLSDKVINNYWDISAKSPIHVHVYDSQGRHTGFNPDNLFDNEIPGSYYSGPTGDETIIFFDPSLLDEIRFEVEAFEEGEFDLVLNQFINGETSSKGFRNIQITENSVGYITMSQEGIQNELSLDIDGNDVIDEVIESSGLPFAEFTYSPAFLTVNETITFDAYLSTDLDGTIESWVWDFGDGSTGTGKIVTHSYSSPGNYGVTLTVTDDTGLNVSAEKTVIVYLQNQPPFNPTLKPDKPEPQPAGTAITWTASAIDPDGDTLYYRFWMKGPATGNSWTIMQDWSTDNTWTWYTSSADIGDTDVSVWIHDGNHKPPDSYDLERIVCDYQIASGTVGAISVTSSPSGATIELDGETFVGPISATPATIPNLSPGYHTIKLTLEGYHDWSRDVKVTAGETTDVHATLTPISGHPLNSVHEKITNNEVDDSDPTIVQISNGDILVAYTNWLNGAQIYLTRSSDNGLTWSTPVAITNQYHNIDPYITHTSDDKVWIVWTGSWVPGDFDNYYVTSDDNGQTWSGIKHIPTPEDWGTHTTIAEDSNYNVWIMWGDHYVISDDFGEHRSQINQMPSWNGNNPSLFCDANGRLWIVTWSGGDIRYKISDDNGQTWSPYTVVVDELSQDEAIVIPEITQFVDGTIWITYHSNINGNREVYYTSSSDNGNTWSNPKQITDNSSQDWMPAIASINDVEIWVTWDSNRDGDRDIYLTKFLIIC
jgi:PKD repeat protein